MSLPTCSIKRSTTPLGALVRAFALSAFALLVVLNQSSFATTLNVPGSYTTIQDAVDAASAGDTVLVADGTYTGDGNRDIDPAGVDMVIKSSGGSSVCIIDCEGGISGNEHRGFTFTNSETSAMKVEGFTITFGYAPEHTVIIGIDTFTVFAGGAVMCDAASPTFEDIVFLQNAAEAGGAVVCILGANASFRNCHFIDNYTYVGPSDAGDGGGFFAFESNVSFVFCSFIFNRAAFDGAGISVDADHEGFTLLLDSCYFAVNVADSGGGALSIFGVALTATNSVFAYNATSFIGGAALLNGRDKSVTSTFTNCTIVGNEVNGSGAGTAIFLEQGANAVIDKCIISDNGGSPNNSALNCESGSTTFTISCTNMWNNLDGNWSACVAGMGTINNNFSADPMYCLTDSSDFSIDVKSQCAAANSPCGELVGTFAPACDLVIVCCVVAGDYTHDGSFNIADVTAGVARIFAGSTAPICSDEADSNGDNIFNIADVTYGVARIFVGSAAPTCGTTGN